MKRRSLIGLFCLLLAMLCIFALTACQTPEDDGEKEPCAHGSMTWIDEVAASCTATGTVGHYTCADCGKNFDANKVEISDLTIPLAHNPGSEWLTENDKHYHACLYGCGAKLDETSCFGDLQHDDTGHWIVCEVCGENTAKTSHDHSANTVTNLGSCTEGGYTTYYCICGHSYIDDETEAADHKYAETWEHNDSYHWHAAICGCEGERSDYERHDYKAVVTAPGCETQGYTTYTCECGDSYVSDYVAARGHLVGEWNETDSTLFDASKCEYRVTYSGHCSICDTDQTKTEQVERHSFFERVTVQATCTSGGQKSTFCSSEGCKYHTNAYKTLEYSDPDAHAWVEDTANSDPENGVTAYKCNEHNCTATKKISSGTTAGVSKEELGNVSEVELKDATIGIGEIKDAIGQNNVNISAGVVEGDVRDTVINNANLSEEQKQLLGDGKIYNFTIMTDGDDEIGDFGDGKATVRIRYELQPTDDPNHIVVWYISAGELTAIEAVYSEDANGDGYVTFRTNHFSYYTVAQVSPELLCEKLGKHDERHLHVVEPTCLTDGYTICLRCGKEVEGSRVAAHGHTMGETVLAEATCATYGIIRHSCADCGLSYQAVTPALGHYYVLSEQVSATCKQAGHVTYTCAHCEDSYTQSICKLAHTYHTTVVEPTCTEGGYTEKTCTQCGEVSTSRHTPAVGHTEGGVWYKNENEHYHICVTCGEKMSAAAHVAGPAATEQTAQICTVCEYTLAAPIVHTHSLTKVAANAATCTLGGNIEYYTCSCGAWFKDANATMPITDHSSVIVDAKGHTPTSTVYVEPSCESVGYTAGVWCDACKTYLRGHIEISAYGHDYQERVTAPTCEQKGSVTYVCAHCGDEDEANARELPALGHNTVSVVTAPTCTDRGYTTHTCLRCKTQLIDTYTEALDHKYSTAYQSNENGHWHVCIRCDAATDSVAHTPDHKEATTEHGIKCVQCSYVIADALAHTHATVQSVAASTPTCTASGNIAYYVCACGEWFYDEGCTNPIYDRASVLLKPVGHSLTYHADQKATCTAVGYTSGAYCETCQTWLNGHEVIPQLDHVYSKVYQTNADKHWHKCETCDATADLASHRYDSKVTAPTCKSGGYTTYICTDCGYTYVGDETPVSDHVFENGKCKWCGMAEPVKPDDPVDPEKPTVVYRWEQEQDGEKMVYLFYSNGEVVATYGDETDTAYWVEKDGFVLLYADAEHKNYFGKATINPDGTITPWVCTEHNYVLVEKTEASCEKGAYEYYQCTECGSGYGHGTEPLGHEYGSDGKCVRCGATGGGDTPDLPIDPDLNNYKKKTLDRMQREWLAAVPNAAVQEAYRAQFEMICEMVSTAKTVEEIDELYYGQFRQIIEKIGNQGGDTPTEPDDPGVPEDPTVVYTYTQKFAESGRVVRYEFYSNGEVRVEFDGMIMILYWAEENGRVAVYMDPDHNDFEERFTVNEKGELEPYQCEGEHKLELVSSSEATCYDEGHTTYICSECGHQVSHYTPALDHAYDENGVCERCGEGSGEEPDESVAYTYAAEVRDGAGNVIGKMLYTFYKNGIVAGRYEENYVEMYWSESDGIVTIYRDEELQTVSGKLVVGEDGSLSLYDCHGKHVYESIVDMAPTCTGDGYVFKICQWCGDQYEETIPAMGHSFSDGFCGFCGEEEYVEDDTPALPEDMTYTYKYVCRYLKGDSVCHEIYIFLEDGTVDARLYVDGKLTAQRGCYWMNDGRLVRMYFDEEYTELINSYTIGDDGTTLTLWKCTEHNYVLMEKTDATCEEGAYEYYQCTDCGSGYGNSGEPLGHAYDENGECERCGQTGSGNEPEDPDLDGYKKEILTQMQNEWLAAVPSAAVEEAYRAEYEMICRMISVAKTFEEIDELFFGQFRPMIDKISNLGGDTPTDPDDPVTPGVLVVYEAVQYMADGSCAYYYFYENGQMTTTYQGQVMELYWAERDGYIYLYMDEDHNEPCGKVTISADGVLTPVVCEEHNYVLIERTEATCETGLYEFYVCSECQSERRLHGPALGHEYTDDGFCTRCNASVGGGEEEDPNLENYRNEILNLMEREWIAAVPNAEVMEAYLEQYEAIRECIAFAESMEEIKDVYSCDFLPLLETVRGNGEEKKRIERIELPFAMPDTESGADVEEFVEAYILRGAIYVYYSDGTMTRVKITRDMVDTMGYEYFKPGYMTFYIYYEGFEVAVEIYAISNCQHENVTTESLAPTCTMAGYNRVFCMDCCEQLSYEHIDVIPHSYVDGACEWCGTGSDDTLEQTRQETLARMIAEWDKLGASDTNFLPGQKKAFKTLVARMNSATTLAEIKKIYQIDFKELLALVYAGIEPENPGEGCEHSSIAGDMRDPSCTENGYRRTYCTDCGEELSYSEIPAYGHIYNEDGICEFCGGDIDDEIEVKPIDPPQFIYVVGIDPAFRMDYSVMVGDDVEAFIREKLIGQSIFVNYSNGTQEIEYVTRDMIDTKGQSFDEFGTVYFQFAYSTGNCGYNGTICINVIKDMSDEKLIATYEVYMPESFMTLQLYESGLCGVLEGEGYMMMGEYRFDDNGVLYVTINNITVLFSVNEDGSAQLYQPKGAVIGVYTYYGMTITVYGKYTGAGEYVATMGADGEVMTTVLVELDLENMTFTSGIFDGMMDIDENGNLVCRHEYVVEEVHEATCTESGYRTIVCSKCGDGFSEQTSEPLGHEYDENGCCVRCDEGGNTDEDLEMIRSEFLKKMRKEWSVLLKEYDVSDEHRMYYEELLAVMEYATDAYELRNLYEKDFMNLCDEIRNTQGGGDDDVGDNEYTAAVINVDILFETNLNVAAGTDMEAFLEQYVLGQSIALYLSDGTTRILSVTRDMVNTYGAGFDEIGDYIEIEVIYPVDGGDRRFYVYVSVQANFEGAQPMGTYLLLQNGAELVFELYDNGYAMVTMKSGDYSDMTSMSYEMKDGGLLIVEMNGTKMLLLAHETGVAEMYQPTGETFVSYTYDGATIDVYGKYTGIGEYVVVIGDVMTSVAVLDLENNTVLIPMLSKGELSIGEGGALYCDHMYEIMQKPEHCTEPGYIEKHCTKCGEWSTDVVAPTGHSYNDDGFCVNCGSMSTTAPEGDSNGEYTKPDISFGDEYTAVLPNVGENGGISYSPIVNENGEITYKDFTTTVYEMTVA